MRALGKAFGILETKLKGIEDDDDDDLLSCHHESARKMSIGKMKPKSKDLDMMQGTMVGGNLGC